MSKFILNNVSPTDLQFEDAGRVALTAFFNLADHWDLSTNEMAQLLGNIKNSRFFEWRKIITKKFHQTQWSASAICFRFHFTQWL
jgi:hypothetical protein